MTISIEILNGLNLAVNQFRLQGDVDEDKKLSIVLLLEQINEAVTACLDGYKASGEIPPAALAKFLTGCEESITLMGKTLDKTTRINIKSVIAQARIFDDDLEKSLDQYKPRLLKILMLGNSIRSLFISSIAINKVVNALAQLNSTSRQLKSQGNG